MIRLVVFLCVSIVAIASALLFSQATQSLPYGSGAYGTCQYSSCSLSLGSEGTVSVDITPSGTTTCTVANDSVSVSTGSTTGYTLTLSSTDGFNTLNGSNGGEITALASTPDDPSPLEANTWGYRVDGIEGFGTGPSSGSTNAGVPANEFAAVPLLGDPATIESHLTDATIPVVTDVWYGACSDTSIPSGTYSDSVLYTAIINS